MHRFYLYWVFANPNLYLLDSQVDRNGVRELNYLTNITQYHSHYSMQFEWVIKKQAIQQTIPHRKPNVKANVLKLVY